MTLLLAIAGGILGGALYGWAADRSAAASAALSFSPGFPKEGRGLRLSLGELSGTARKSTASSMNLSVMCCLHEGQDPSTFAKAVQEALASGIRRRGRIAEALKGSE